MSDRAADLNSVSDYVRRIRSLPLLTREEETRLATIFQQTGDRSAADRLITAHLRLVVKIAMGYRGYGLPVSDLISEGNVGLMQAVNRFDATKGFTLSTYARWWIRAEIQDFVLRNWSLVRLGTTPAQRSLFFNLRKAREKLAALDPHAVDRDGKLARQLGVRRSDVESMTACLAGDVSLNAPIGPDRALELIEVIVDEREDPESGFAERQHAAAMKERIELGLNLLGDREGDILRCRRLLDPAATLEELAVRYGVSRERVRQIEMAAFDKLQRFIVDGVVPQRAAQKVPAPAAPALRESALEGV